MRTKACQYRVHQHVRMEPTLHQAGDLTGGSQIRPLFGGIHFADRNASLSRKVIVKLPGTQAASRRDGESGLIGRAPPEPQAVSIRSPLVARQEFRAGKKDILAADRLQPGRCEAMTPVTKERHALIAAVQHAGRMAMRLWFLVFCAVAILGSDATGQTASFPESDERAVTRLDAVDKDLDEDVAESLGQIATVGFSTSVDQPKSSLLGQLAWQKSGFRIVPYGAFWADMIYATERTDPGSYTLFVPSRQQQGEGAFTIDTRRTRLGADVNGPRIEALGDVENGGRVEIDFHGNFVTENRAGVLLREAYWEAKNERFRILIGQTSDVISPLYPGTLNYSVGWAGGNIGFRRAQFRAERYLAASEQMWFTFQGALCQDIVADFPTDPGVIRETSDWPIVQARTAVTLGPRGANANPIELGFSGHVGETGFDFLVAGPPPLSLQPQDDARFKTWSFNVDLQVPFGPWMGFQGEFFTGANLSSFLGGIGQGVCPCLRVPIRSTGGWGQLWFDWTSSLRSYAGFGIDDPNNNDILFGRTCNQFIFANLVVDVANNLTTGIEVTYWKTLYQERRVGLIPADQLSPAEPGKSVVIDWMVKYSF